MKLLVLFVAGAVGLVLGLTFSARYLDTDQASIVVGNSSSRTIRLVLGGESAESIAANESRSIAVSESEFPQEVKLIDDAGVVLYERLVSWEDFSDKTLRIDIVP